MCYSIIRPLLFTLPPEASHAIALISLDISYKLKNLLPQKKILEQSIKVMGIDFPNRLGLAAGLDKNADHVDALGALGFGFIEVGTVTPLAQSGNPKPRLFRLPQKQAFINRLGFNNKGIDYLCERVKKIAYRGVLGINIGKNAQTPIENAIDDYLIGLRKAYPLAHYITINISSPNTQDLRELQFKEHLEKLLQALKAEQLELAHQYDRYIPLAIKIAPDLTEEQIVEIANLLLAHKMDAVIATNTTITRTGVENLKYADEKGGLSGSPITKLSTEVIKILRKTLQGKIPIIAVGGIMSVADAQAKINAGADLIQVYTGFIYQGPALIRSILKQNW